MKSSSIGVLLLAAATVTCGDSVEPTPVQVPAAVTIVGGNNQPGVVGRALLDSFAVRVVDGSGRAMPGIEVHFSAASDASPAAISPRIVSADASGRAAAMATLGPTPGEWQFEARVAGAVGKTVVAGFVAVAKAGTPAAIRPVKGEQQRGRVGVPLPDSLVVQVEDAFTNPVPDVEVSWQVLGGGSLSSVLTVTGTNGRTGVQRTLGSSTGDQGAMAIITAAQISPVEFHHTGIVGDASALLTLAGAGQTGPVGKPLPAQTQVRIVDPYGNPVPERMVFWTAGQGGSADPASIMTDSDGVAATVWTLGGALGEQTLTAAAGELAGLTLTAHATPGSPAQVAIIVQPPISAVNGAVFERAPRIELRDTYGNRAPIDGVLVRAEVASGTAASLSGTISAATRLGVATFDDLRLSGTAGTYTLRFTSPELSPGTSGPLSLLAGAPAGINLVTQPSAGATAGQPFARQPSLEVRDGGGNLLSGVPVSAVIASGGGTLSGATIVSTVSGVARYEALSIGGGSGTRTLRFSASTVSVISQDIVITAPPEATAGQWSPVMSSPLVATHMHLLPDGMVLMFGNKGLPHLWDAVSQQFTAVPSPANLFCSGHTFLPDGRLLVTGGHITDDHGLPAATLFDFRTRAWTSGPSMARGRWYPTATTLSSGEVLTVAGADENGIDVPIPEVWTAAETWRQLNTASRKQVYYPRMFLAPNGRVYDVGPTQATRSLNPSGTGSWSTGPSSRLPYRDYGSAVMYQPGKILIVGGGGVDSNSAPTSTAEVLDLNQTAPSWRLVQAMQYGRRHLNATLLPTGEVLVTGGTSASGFNNPAGSVHAAELWNPQTEQWTTLASNQVERVYHSTSLLLPDGRVLHSGSGESLAPDQRNYEIFSPPYLFKGARPVINSAPAAVGYAETFSVGTAEAASISKVSWVRLGSVTHAFDQNQRFLDLAFARTQGGLLVTAPASANLAPPGHYMMFILDDSGIPSVARIVQVR